MVEAIASALRDCQRGKREVGACVSVGALCALVAFLKIKKIKKYKEMLVLTSTTLSHSEVRVRGTVD